MKGRPYIIVVYAFRDGNTRELFYAFDEAAAEDAEFEAAHDQRFGRVGRDVGFAILREAA